MIPGFFLPVLKVFRAARACGIPETDLECLEGNRPWKITVVSSHGWNFMTDADRAALTRRIADVLEKQGYICAFDTHPTLGRYEATFERMP